MHIVRKRQYTCYRISHLKSAVQSNNISVESLVGVERARVVVDYKVFAFQVGNRGDKGE